MRAKETSLAREESHSRRLRQVVARVRIHSLFCNRAKAGQHNLHMPHMIPRTQTRTQASPRASGITTKAGNLASVAFSLVRHLGGSQFKARRTAARVSIPKDMISIAHTHRPWNSLESRWRGTEDSSRAQARERPSEPFELSKTTNEYIEFCYK